MLSAMLEIPENVKKEALSAGFIQGLGRKLKSPCILFKTEDISRQPRVKLGFGNSGKCHPKKVKGKQ